MENDILKNLNPAQREAVETTEGAVLIIAGAGSGKTRALTHRVAYLIKEKKIPPRNILAVTFTNKAAQEMKERVRVLLDVNNQKLKTKNYELPIMGTFHSICARILRHEIEKLGYKKTFNIFDDQDQLATMKKAMKESEMDMEQFKPQAMLNAISKAKNELIDAATTENPSAVIMKKRCPRPILLTKKNSKSKTRLILTILSCSPSNYSGNFRKFWKNTRIFSAISWWTNTKTLIARNIP